MTSFGLSRRKGKRQAWSKVVGIVVEIVLPVVAQACRHREIWLELDLVLYDPAGPFLQIPGVLSTLLDKRERTMIVVVLQTEKVNTPKLVWSVRPRRPNRARQHQT
jgi:hypothetical protein